MNTIDFCFWLQGYFELQNEPGPMSARQAEVIRNHLNLVFKHEIDPLRDSQTETSVDVLEQAHEGTADPTEADKSGFGPQFGPIPFIPEKDRIIKC